MNAAFDYRAARESIFGSSLPGPLRLLALALVEFMPNARPSVPTLAGQCGVERKTVLRALARLERMGVLAIERSPGQRSRYVLQPVPSWRTGTPEGPVPLVGTGTESSPVPTEPGTGTKSGMGPVPTEARTSPIAGGPEAEEADQKAGGKRARGAFDAVTRTLTLPGPDPTESYLASCVMAGVRPEQARSTWGHYFGQGLPPGGVERLEAWLVQRAAEKQTSSTKLPRGVPRPEETLDTTGAATRWRPNTEHRAFGKDHLPHSDIEDLGRLCRLVPRFEHLSTVDQDREFLARLRCLKATGTFLSDGPMPRPPKKAGKEMRP